MRPWVSALSMPREHLIRSSEPIWRIEKRVHALDPLEHSSNRIDAVDDVDADAGGLESLANGVELTTALEDHHRQLLERRERQAEER